MSVLYALGIDNILCEIDGPEVPIMDGSAASFLFLIKENGIKDLYRAKNFLVVLDKVEVKDGENWATIEPADNLEINSTIIFAHSKIKKQEFNFKFSSENFIEEIARARTFGFSSWIDGLRKKGLIKGASLNNAIVLDDYKVINPDGLRFKNEFVRHKILDTIGDIALLGNQVAGKITTYKSGHYLHNQLCRKLLETPHAYQIVAANILKNETLQAFSLPQTISLTY
jgi:UDP-3-O-[3-hydroxymyristoyl] N-acetylglucosamine deacetylase